MHPTVAQALLDLNQRFYTDFGASFAATRRRIQPGIHRVLVDLPDAASETWLDLGCGSGALAVEWLRLGRASAYLGMDFSSALLEEARQAVSALPGHQRVSFLQENLASEGWGTALKKTFPVGFAGILCFAVLHHLPSRTLRERVLRQAASLIPAGGMFIHSVWQFQHSPKLMERRASWDQVGLAADDLEPGDTLLDWRAASPGQPGETGLRYVHLFDLAELAELAQSTGFQITQTFESDGQGGRLGLYQTWIRLP